MWYIAARSSAPVVVAAQAFTDSRERKSPRHTPLPTIAADGAAFSAVFPILVKASEPSNRVIIYRSFYREATQTAGAITLALTIVLVLFGFTETLGQIVRGDYAQGVVFELIGWETLRRIDLLLPLGFYLGVLLTFSRWYRDSEMTVLAACGIGLGQLLKPVMLLAAIVGALVAAAAFVLTPYTSRAIGQVKAEGAQRPELTGITPGAFTESTAGGRILYAEEVDNDGTMSRIFLSNVSGGRARVILARSGQSYIDRTTGRRQVVLQDGWAYEGTPAQADYRVAHFDRYSVWLDQKRIVPPPETIEGLPTRTLLAMPGIDAAAEWQWRLAKPLAVFVLALFALVLAHTDARRGRLANLFGAILVYFIYSNLLGLSQTLFKKGQAPSGLGMWWVHAVMFAVVLYLFFQRARNRPLLPPMWTARKR
jgi:lipopolysaccharide export system permease protein